MKRIRKIEKAQKEIWCKVGVIVQLSQMIEYNLTNILALDEILREFDVSNSMFVFEYNEYVRRSNKLGHELELKPLGIILQKAKDVHFFTEESLTTLSEVLRRRNHIAHHFFKDDLIPKKLENDPSCYYNYLEETIELMHVVNDSLLKINEQQRKEIKLIY